MDPPPLPPDASIADIESDRQVYQIMLETLDVDEENFLSTKQRYEQALEDLDRLHAERDPAFGEQHYAPSTPHGPSPGFLVNGSRSSTQLPSRERPSIPNWGQSMPSPTTQRSRPADGPRGQQSSYGVAASGSMKKRPREISNALRPNEAASHNKSRRTSDSTSASQASTPASLDSLDDGDITLSAIPKDAYRVKMEQRQREAEERYRRERLDAEYARMISQMPDDATFASSSRPMNTQSFLGQGATIERPQAAVASPFQMFPAQTSAASAQRNDFGGAHGYGFPPPSISRPTAAQRIKSEPNYEQQYRSPSDLPSMSAPGTHQPGFLRDDDDSDFQVISPQQFQAQSMTSPHRRRLPAPVPSASFNNFSMPSMPGAFPTQENYQPAYTPRQSLPGSTDRADIIATMNRMLQAPIPMASGPMHGLGGASVFNPTYPQELDSDSDDGEDPYAGLSEHQLERIRAGGLDYMLQDSQKTREDLLQLLDNIRPDEDVLPDQRIEAPPGLQCTLMPHQQLGYSWLKKQEEGNNKGGILADDMGLGKTIQALALMLGRRSSDPACKTTLIVAPLALMRQWEREIERKVCRSHRLKVFIYHGATPTKAQWPKLAGCDVVLTTYGTITAEWKRKQDWELKKLANPNAVLKGKGPLTLFGDRSHFYRVVLDEAQGIKNRSTKTSNAAWHLVAKYRLCMTGTPMMNSITELFSLIKFLRVGPYNVWEQFNKDFAKPLKTGRKWKQDKAMERLQAVIKAILLRRTKESRIDNHPILHLPPRVTEIQHAVFDEEQSAFYKSLEMRTRLEFNRYLQNGTVGQNYSNMLVLLLRLRQCCDHPHLIKHHSVPAAELQISPEAQEDIARQFSNEAVKMIREADSTFECPICYDGSEDPTIFFPCGHDVCGECFTRLSDPVNAATAGEDSHSVKCPECRQRIDVKKIVNYTVFRKIRLPDLCPEEEQDVVKKEEEDVDSETDSDSDDDDSDDDSDDDADSQGDLRDFIVGDDEEEDNDTDAASDGDDLDRRVKRKNVKDEDVTDEEAEDVKPRNRIKDEDEDSAFEPKRPGTQRRTSGAKGTSMFKGKGKGKGRKKNKSKKKPARTLAILKRESTRNAKAKRRYIKELRKNFVSSAKIDKTLEILDTIRTRDSGEKTIIFSQFTTFLDLLEVPLMDRKWPTMRYDGSMTAKAREQAVDVFETDPACTIMLISLKAGNAGLNLNWASQVIILDPFWNPYVEEQAIDRAHRIGQQRSVTVHRVLVPETVEDRILLLQDQKRELITSALDESAAKNIGRLGVQQLAYLFGVGGGGPPPQG